MKGSQQHYSQEPKGRHNPNVNVWINKLWCIHSMDYYSALTGELLVGVWKPHPTLEVGSEPFEKSTQSQASLHFHPI